MEPKIVADYANKVGEGPLWHPIEQRLYWVDITAGRMFRYDPASGTHEQFYQGPVVGGFTIQEDGALLLFMEKGAVAVWRDGELSYIVDEIPEKTGKRFNDIIADPAGRVFCGEMAEDHTRPLGGERGGGLYRLDTDGSITRLLDGLGLPNGMGFTPDRTQMYFTDTADGKIYLFNYDARTGDISNRSVFVQVPREEGLPDGMTVDAEGYVWSARVHRSALYRYTPEGVEERAITFPAKKVSSVTFAGGDLTDMYVTTIGGDDKAENGPGAGALFRMNLGIRGVSEFLSRVAL